MNKEEKRLYRIISHSNGNRGSSILYEEIAGIQYPYPGNNVGKVNWNSSSLAETMLGRYGSNKRNDVDHNFPNLPIRTWLDDRLYPYHLDEPKCLSSFPIGVRGWFKCVSSDHFQRKECPLDKVQDRATLDTFYR